MKIVLCLMVAVGLTLLFGLLGAPNWVNLFVGIVLGWAATIIGKVWQDLPKKDSKSLRISKAFHHIAIDGEDGESTNVELQEDVDLFDREHPYFPEIGHPIEVPTILTLGPTEVIGDAPRRTATTEELFTTAEDRSFFGPEFWRKI